MGDDLGLLAVAALLEAGQAVCTVAVQEPQSHSYCCRTKSSVCRRNRSIDEELIGLRG